MNAYIKVLGFLTVCALTGLGLAQVYTQVSDYGSQTSYGNDTLMVNDTGTYEIDGYTFHLQNSSQNIGFNYALTQGYAVVGGDEIWIRTPNSAEYIYEVCVHEKLHALGIDGDGHDWVYDKQDQIVDGTCLRLLAKLEG